MPGSAEEQHQDGVDAQGDHPVHPLLVPGGHFPEVGDHRGRAGHAVQRQAGQRAAGRRGFPGDPADLLEGLQARVGERVGLEDQVDPGDVVEVGRARRCGRDVSGVDERPAEPVGEPLLNALGRRFPAAWRSSGPRPRCSTPRISGSRPRSRLDQPRSGSRSGGARSGPSSGRARRPGSSGGSSSSR